MRNTIGQPTPVSSLFAPVKFENTLPMSLANTIVVSIINSGKIWRNATSASTNPSEMMISDDSAAHEISRAPSTMIMEYRLSINNDFSTNANRHRPRRKKKIYVA